MPAPWFCCLLNCWPSYSARPGNILMSAVTNLQDGKCPGHPWCFYDATLDMLELQCELKLTGMWPGISPRGRAALSSCGSIHAGAGASQSICGCGYVGVAAGIPLKRLRHIDKAPLWAGKILRDSSLWLSPKKEQEQREEFIATLPQMFWSMNRDCNENSTLLTWKWLNTSQPMGEVN